MFTERLDLRHVRAIQFFCRLMHETGLDQCPMPINADQNSGIDPNVDQEKVTGSMLD